MCNTLLTCPQIHRCTAPSGKVIVPMLTLHNFPDYAYHNLFVSNNAAGVVQAGWQQLQATTCTGYSAQPASKGGSRMHAWA